MKKIPLLIIAFVSLITSSCKKDTFHNSPVASLTLVNAIIAGKSLKVGSMSNTIANNSSSQLAVNAGVYDLYIWPLGDSLHPYYTYEKFSTEDHKTYSLFLGGTASAVDGILIKEEIPYHTDSTSGIRFINLSPNSPQLNISLSATPSVNIVSNLGYKQYTEFKSFPALASTPPFSFQIKNAATGALLLTYAFSNINPIPRFSNITLVIRGLVGSTPTIGITRVAQDR